MENYMLVFILVMSLLSIANGKTKTEIKVGVILDNETSVGKMSRRCISMALHDFYQQHDNYTTRIVTHFRDSKQDNVEAASATIDLLKNEQVMAILGPTTSSQADFVIDIGSKSSVPIISPATSPSLSPNDTPYFIRSSHDSSSQLKPIAELIKHFGWREVVFIYEDGDYGRGLIPYISNALMNVEARIMYRTVIHHSASDDWILKELYKMKTMQTRVFIVHALPKLATRFFKKVNEAGMMEEGYAWIITEVLTGRLHCLDHSDIDSMQGVLDVFNAVIGALPYAVKIEFIPFVIPDGTRAAGTYNDLLRNLSNGKYDAVAGDITILAERAKYVDFTLPYTEAGFSMIVPIKVDDRKSPWIFMRPLETNLWITIGAFFIYTGLVVWVVEHRVNEEFRGPPRQQVGMIFWFSFSTLVFAHREKLISNLSRFVVIVWVFVVLVLTSSYTASLTSILTVQKLQPAYTDIDKIMSNGESVGYQDGTFVRDKLIAMGFQESKIKNYSTFEQYDEALALGSQNGGVSAIMDGVPYIKVFLAKYCTKYTMTGPIYKTTGFGFAFQKGSPLVADVSRAVLQVTEEQMRNISNQWFGEPTSCDQQKEASLTSDRLTLESFKGLFIIAGLSSTSALLLFLFRFSYEVKDMLASQGSLGEKISSIVKTFDVYKDRESKPTSPAISPYHDDAGFFSSDEGFSTTEPGTPVHETIQVVESNIETNVHDNVTSTSR